jgi:hypothetical protein
LDLRFRRSLLRRSSDRCIAGRDLNQSVLHRRYLFLNDDHWGCAQKRTETVAMPLSQAEDHGDPIHMLRVGLSWVGRIEVQAPFHHLHSSFAYPCERAWRRVMRDYLVRRRRLERIGIRLADRQFSWPAALIESKFNQDPSFFMEPPSGWRIEVVLGCIRGSSL